MREIKFRAWLPGIKKMTYSHTLEELMNWDTKKEDNGTAIWMEYTGLKDRDGKEIFEGDIVETSHRIFDEEKKHLNEVVFSDFCWRVHSIGDDKAADIPLGLYAKEPGSIVVVGNIYEQKENRPEAAQ